MSTVRWNPIHPPGPRLLDEVDNPRAEWRALRGVEGPRGHAVQAGEQYHWRTEWERRA